MWNVVCPKKSPPLSFIPTQQSRRRDHESHQSHRPFGATEGTPYVWVSPDLVDDDGYEVSLAEILHENGFQKNQVVTLFFDFPDVWLEAVE
jgi:hypothetical protein